MLYTKGYDFSSFITHPRNMNDIAHNLAQVRDKFQCCCPMRGVRQKK